MANTQSGDTSLQPQQATTTTSAGAAGVSSRAALPEPQSVATASDGSVQVQFRVDDLVRRLVTGAAASHCGGCYGCSGCSMAF